MEAIEKISIVAKKTPIIKVNEENRIGDHQWYVTNNGKFQKDYPNWKISYSLENLIEEMVFVAQNQTLNEKTVNKYKIAIVGAGPADTSPHKHYKIHKPMI